MKYFKLLLILSILFLVNIGVKAEDRTDNCAESSVKEECVNTITFCYEDKEYEGCPFDQTQSIYSTSKGTSEFVYAIAPPWAYEKVPWMYVDNDVPLERSYAVVDKNNNVAFIGCYKGEMELRPQSYATPPYDDDALDINITKKCNSSSDMCLGTAYFFKIIAPNKKTCIPSDKGTALYMAIDSKITQKYGTDIADWNSRYNINIGKDNWTPLSTGSCPKYLNFNPDVGGFFDPTNKYRVSDDLDMKYDKNAYTAISDFFTHKYNANHELTGCTTEDTVGTAEVLECFENKAKLIRNFNCPNDSSGYNKLKENIDAYQNECTVKYTELYSNGLITQSIENYLKIINNAVIQVVDECYEEKCGVDSTKVKEYTKGTICEDGCVDDAKDQSDSAAASCWMCTGGSEAVYKWRDSTEITSESTCHPESGVSKEDCYGTVSGKACYTCLKKAYENAGLTNEQISCIEEGEAVKKKLIKDIEDYANEHKEEILDQNAQNAVHHIFFSIPDLLGWGFGDAKDCSEIFGKDIGLKIIRGIVNVIRIGAAIIAIANAMVTLIPAVISKDSDGLKKSGRKLVTMAIVLAIIGILPSIVHLIGLMFGYDISCIF